MKTIASLNVPEFLRACNATRHAVEDFIAETGVMELRKIKPTIPENATAEQKEKLTYEQGKKNLSAMLDRALDEHPEATYKVVESLLIPENGEQPDGMDIITAFMELISSPKVVNFFTRLAALVRQNMGG